MQFDFGEDVVTLESLDSQRRVISLESANLSQTVGALTTRLPRFLEDVKSFVGKHLNPFAQNVNLVDSRKLEARFKTIDYITAGNLGVFVPMGFKGTWPEYVALLDRSQKVVDDVRKGLLNPFEAYLSMLLTEHDHLRDSSVGPQLSRYKSPDMEGLKKAFAGFFGTGTQTEATYGDVVKRHADLPVVSRDLNEVNTRFASIDRTGLLKQVQNIAGMLGQLIENIEEHPEEYVVSGAVLRALTDLTYFMAQEVEYYTIHGYNLDAFTLSVKDSYKRLEKAVLR